MSYQPRKAVLGAILGLMRNKPLTRLKTLNLYLNLSKEEQNTLSSSTNQFLKQNLVKLLFVQNTVRTYTCTPKNLYAIKYF